jgi:hypothetical protein
VRPLPILVLASGMQLLAIWPLVADSPNQFLTVSLGTPKTLAIPSCVSPSCFKSMAICLRVLSTCFFCSGDKLRRAKFCVGNEGRMNQPYTLKPAWLLGCEGYDGFLPTCYV